MTTTVKTSQPRDGLNRWKGNLFRYLAVFLFHSTCCYENLLNIRMVIPPSNFQRSVTGFKSLVLSSNDS